jgi:hypothetical protein
MPSSFLQLVTACHDSNTVAELDSRHPINDNDHSVTHHRKLNISPALDIAAGLFSF